MRRWLTSVAQWWSDWVGDSDMERSIRQHLDQSGYYGKGAKLSNVRLVAIQRPGWLQIFRFEAEARVRIDVDEDADGPDPPPQYVQLFGLIQHDFRKSIANVRLFEEPAARKQQFRSWAEGLIQLRGAQGLG